ncbi:MAG: Rnase Y domain-containing protein, partial [Acidimicrobiia bacterium]
MEYVVGAAGLAAGGLLGFLWTKYRAGVARASAESTAEGMVAKARLEAQELLSRGEEEARAKAEAYREREEAALEHRKIELNSSEERLGQREQTLEQRASNLAQREQLLISRENETQAQRVETEKLREQARAELERLAGFDAAAAKSNLLHQVEDEARREAMVLVRDMEVRAREEADRRARRILATAIQRLAAEVVTE